MSQLVLKDPDAVLDYRFDAKAQTNGTGNEDFLTGSDTIASFSITAEAGLTVDSSSKVDDDTAVIAWLSGGTLGQAYLVNCRINSSAGRTQDKTIRVRIASI